MLRRHLVYAIDYALYAAVVCREISLLPLYQEKVLYQGFSVMQDMFIITKS